MSNLYDIMNTISVALKDDTGFDRVELQEIMVELHAKLTEPKWAIEDEVLREECEKLVVAWAANEYLSANTKGSDLRLDSPETKEEL